MLKQAFAIAKKDWQLEAGRKSLVISLLFISFILTFLSSFAIAFAPTVKPVAGALVIWLILISNAYQTLNRSLNTEIDWGCWDALCLCPISPQAIFLGKFIYNGLVLISVQLIIFPFYLIFFNLELRALLMLIPLFLSSLGFVGIGLFFALLALKTPGRELTLQTTSLPIMLPSLFLGLRATLELAHGSSINQVWDYLILLIVFDLILIAVAFFAFDPKISE